MTTLTEIKEILDDINAKLPLLIASAKITPEQLQVLNGLSDISVKLGLIRTGELRSGNNAEPGRGFSGVRIGWPPFIYATESGDEWNIAGVDNDSLQFGLRAEDGVGLFAGGKGVLDSDALKFSGITYGLQHTATYSGETRVAKIGMVVPDGGSEPAYRMTFEESVIVVELMTNGDAEAGATTGWTDASSAWSAYLTSPYAGTYSFRHDPTNTGCPAQLSQSVTGLTPDIYYTISFVSKLASGEFPPKVILTWKDGGGSTLRTDTIFGTTGSSWSSQSQNTKSPLTTASVTITLDPGDQFGDALFDSISLYASGITRSFSFEPDATFRGGSVVIGDAALTTSATEGFLYIPTCAGTPTGVPTSKTGTAAMVFDTSNNKLYVYDGGWVDVT